MPHAGGLRISAARLTGYPRVPRESRGHPNRGTSSTTQVHAGRRWEGGILIRRLLVAGTLLLVAYALHAQATGTTTGDIRGRIIEESGVVVPGVVVTARNQETGLTRSATSLSDGSYTLRLLPPGLYSVAAAPSGFQSIELPDIRVMVGSSANVQVRLRLFPVTEAVTVRAEADLIDRTSTEVSKTIGERKIRNLPINQRDFLEFALTTPGVTVDRAPQTGAGATSGLSINGQSPRYNNVLVDGLDNNDSSVGSVRSTFSQEAVREYQVIQSPFDAEYGRTAGGIINVVTRSGSKDFRGSAFYFFRDDHLAADNKLTGTKTPFEQKQYGASLGGPLWPDRLFFFGAGERLDVSDANVVTISDEAVAAIRANGFDVQNGVLPFDKKRDSALLKLDLLANASNSFALRGTYSKESDENQQPWGGLVARSDGGVRDIQDTALALTGTSILTANLSNEVRALASGRKLRLKPLDPSGDPYVTILTVRFRIRETRRSTRCSTRFPMFRAQAPTSSAWITPTRSSKAVFGLTLSVSTSSELCLPVFRAYRQAV